MFAWGNMKAWLVFDRTVFEEFVKRGCSNCHVQIKRSANSGLAN